jgi:hypothetical protein
MDEKSELQTIARKCRALAGKTQASRARRSLLAAAATLDRMADESPLADDERSAPVDLSLAMRKLKKRLQT